MTIRIALAVILIHGLFGGMAIAAEGYELLFKGTASKLSKQEKRQIFKKLGFSLSKNNKFIIDEDCGEDVFPMVEVVDLNGDGIEEIFVSWGNICTSGMTGHSISLFVKDRHGQYVDNLGFPGSCEILTSSKEGFHDLKINGPGFCHGIWRWAGEKYKYKCSVEEESGGCNRKGVKTICE